MWTEDQSDRGVQRDARRYWHGSLRRHLRIDLHLGAIYKVGWRIEHDHLPAREPFFKLQGRAEISIDHDWFQLDPRSAFYDRNLRAALIEDQCFRGDRHDGLRTRYIERNVDEETGPQDMVSVCDVYLRQQSSR
jgi:hypothetical protein